MSQCCEVQSELGDGALLCQQCQSSSPSPAFLSVFKPSAEKQVKKSEQVWTRFGAEEKLCLVASR